MGVKRTKKVIAIVGPTASGKTGIGVRLAKEFDGEIVSADSRQVYRGLDIGTGKDLEEYDGVRYNLIDIVDPMEKMTLFDYLPKARAAIEDILSRGKLPIIVGGTGLYVQGLVEGFELQEAASSRQPAVKPPIYTREALNNLTVEQLNSVLEKLDPQKHEGVDRKNQHRLIRAIELTQEGLKPMKKQPDFEVLQIALDLPRKELYERIDRRVDERFDQGMMNEVINLLKRGVAPEWLVGLGLEYREMTEYILEIAKTLDCSIADLPDNLATKQFSNEFGSMSQRLKYKIHQFARRQLIWLRRFPAVNWLSDYKDIKRFVQIFLTH